MVHVVLTVIGLMMRCVIMKLPDAAEAVKFPRPCTGTYTVQLQLLGIQRVKIDCKLYFYINCIGSPGYFLNIIF